jgi:hypothetical protein
MSDHNPAVLLGHINHFRSKFLNALEPAVPPQFTVEN